MRKLWYGTIIALFALIATIAGAGPSDPIPVQGILSVENGGTGTSSSVTWPIPCIDAVSAYGLVGDGTTDNTAAFQLMMATGNRSLCIRQGDYKTGKFTVPSGLYLYLDPNTIIRDSGVLGTNERFVSITNDDIHIVGYGAEILMSRADYPSGEQRHGIFIYGASNITIEGLASNSTGGDGFYIGGATGDAATNIKLIRVSADNNRRQGLSIVQGNIVHVTDSQFTNTNGTAPEAGIDIEPNDPTDTLQGIVLENVTATGNNGAGIQVFFGSWGASTNVADITLQNIYTENNGNATQAPGVDFSRVLSATPPKGAVRLINYYGRNETNACIRIQNWDESGPLVNIVRPSLYECNTAGTSNSTYAAPITIYSSGAYTTTPGNVWITQPKIYYSNNGTGSNPISINSSGGGWGAVTITDANINAASFSNPWFVAAETRGIKIINNSPPSVANTGTLSMTDGRYIGRVINNTGSSGTTIVNLPAASSATIGWIFNFAVTVANSIRIDPNGTNTIQGGGAAGNYIASSTIGSTIQIEGISSTEWRINSLSGTWTFENGISFGPTATTSSGNGSGNLTSACTTTPTQSYSYQKNGNVVTLVLGSISACTSDSTAFILDAGTLPVEIRPSTIRCAGFISGTDNTFSSVMVNVGIYTDGSVNYTAGASGCTLTTWTSSGNKSLNSGSVTYTLN